MVKLWSRKDGVVLQGDVYIGEFKDGKPNGLGTMTWSNLQKKSELKKMDMELLIGQVVRNMLVSGKMVKRWLRSLYLV